MSTTKIHMECTNPECNHDWNYEGESRWYVTCPRCRRNLRIREKVLSQPQRSVKGWTHVCKSGKERTFTTPGCPDCGAVNTL